MYRCILAPVDGTAFGEHALPHAASLARRSGATLHLAHVHEPTLAPVGLDTVAYRGAWSDILKEQQAGYLEGLAERLARAYGIRVTTRVMDGPVVESLERYATECQTGLVVMSAHGHAGVSRLWHHCVAEQMARDLPVPVLMVRPPAGMDEPKLEAEVRIGRILVPLDGTPQAEEVLEHALAVGALFRASFLLLRVVEQPHPLSALLVGDEHEIHHQLVRAQSAARQYLNSVAERLRARGLAVETHVCVSDEPGAAILSTAEDAAHAPVDLIALERYPHRPIRRVLGTHTSDAVLKRAQVPVLVLGQAPLAERTTDTLLAMAE